MLNRPVCEYTSRLRKKIVRLQFLLSEVRDMQYPYQQAENRGLDGFSRNPIKIRIPTDHLAWKSVRGVKRERSSPYG
ncbi:hypothetical protein FF011L_26270 [Roseimaritima multifibrata]|uniref:Uncharacterized protein n=1 Tax=Roseimaritima multifibrata TaxID=1930274 RepID=A0A517MG45_9BACT|nr:hypothetical protein FF011L_26270 [Roseimaritima multifibrata]